MIPLLSIVVIKVKVTSIPAFISSYIIYQDQGHYEIIYQSQGHFDRNTIGKNSNDSLSAWPSPKLDLLKLKHRTSQAKQTPKQ